MKQNYNSFWYQEGSWIQIRKILSDTTLIILERIMYLAMIWLLVEYWFQSHWSDGKHNAKVYGQWIKFDRQQVNINAYVRWSAIIVVQENIWIIFVTLIFCIDLYFLCEYFLYLSVITFTPVIRVLLAETPSLVMLVCIW